MSGCAVSLAGLKCISDVLNELLNEISFCSQRYSNTDFSKAKEVNLKVDQCVETLKRKLKMQGIYIDYLSRRVGVQLTAASSIHFHHPRLPTSYCSRNPANPRPTQLFNLIAQQEAKVAIAVAEDSRTLAFAGKEDSTAMKTPAGVTVAFLPGTFVAAVFAMPLFDWNASGGGTVVSNRFWIYGAPTVPLTLGSGCCGLGGRRGCTGIWRGTRGRSCGRTVTLKGLVGSGAQKTVRERWVFERFVAASYRRMNHFGSSYSYSLLAIDFSKVMATRPPQAPQPQIPTPDHPLHPNQIRTKQHKLPPPLPHPSPKPTLSPHQNEPITLHAPAPAAKKKSRGPRIV